MTGQTKTDNKALAPKLAIRRHLLTTFHAGTIPSVFDACQGGGVLWTRLREEFECRYWGVDVKLKKGRVAVESSRVLEQPGWDFDVVDIDTYGAPWKHYAAVCRNLTKPTTVFLTIGSTLWLGAMDTTSLEALGLASLMNKMPKSFRRKVTPLGVDHCVAMCYTYNVEAVAAWRASAGNATYYGIRLAPARN